ncbi:Oxoglutarate and iron-dependent oxygenase degradation C-term-domain-containing protein [Boletus coccyginus]|nr:Oxoglutarate and iron-dependent oxygenase degradation C-term-domain-containing protein [Boletus coccyginus]
MHRPLSNCLHYDDLSDDTEPPHPDVPLSPAYTSFLVKYLTINPAQLRLRTLKTVIAKLVNESTLQLQSFLVDELAAAVEEGLGEADVTDGLDGAPKDPLTNGALARIHRSTTRTVSSSSSTTARTKAEGLREFQDTFFPSVALRAWLTIVTKLIPLSCAVEARRFRSGLDYTLAASNEGESRLDVVQANPTNATREC